MRTKLRFVIAVLFTMSCATVRAQSRKSLEVYFIDVEGGQFNACPYRCPASDAD